ncbi:MFS transporter [Nocardioides guangzhouensis]|uniref:MFS transporter n=2 Tax=Nocardioides guangzhouensis TaxID=2497878 RepID=A0A4Q4ZN87_9ACTN|nr:MFS transporter [Nocardioides guangzhouensis]
MVYEGMRSIAGPFLASLGASALTVGVVTGAGEGIALVLRLVAGPIADRTQRHWALTILGYAMTAVCVPLLAVAPALGSLGLGVAAALILLERTGKALRSPSKSVLLAAAAHAVGRGKGFGVHKALDQVGAFAGPLVVAGVVAVSGTIWPAFALLAIPGAVSLVLLAVLRTRLAVSSVEPAPAAPAPRVAPGGRPRLPGTFHAFATAVAVSTAGLMTFGIFGYHLVDAGLVSDAGVPVVYAGAMAAGAVSALAAGAAYDRWNHAVLLLLPALVAPVPALALAGSLGPVLAGIGLWGAATGIQDSTVKALVADLVAPAGRATAYGVFAAYQGVAALVGGTVAGALYRDHATLLATGIAVLQVAAYLPLVRALRAARLH